jgi:protein-S-isoprenylcysteine O-methyltransferase Ste14
VIPQRPAIAFRHAAVSAKVGKISSKGIVLAEEALWPAPADEAMISSTICEIVWFAGLVAWYIIRYPFERRAKKVGVTKSFFGRRESGLLAVAFLGLWLVPLIYALTGFPAALDRPMIPAIAILGIVTLCGALLLFYRSHADLGKNWSISLQIRDEHRLVTSGIYRFIRHPMYTSFFLLAIAQVLLLPNWFAGLAGLVGVTILYAFRVRQEERMMLERFGTDYQAYMARTARVIPWIA